MVVKAAFSAEEYKRAVGSFITGLTVVTASRAEGPVGFTCQSFTSLSLSPPTILVSMARASRTYPAIALHSKFCVNILGLGFDRLASDFAVLEPRLRFTRHAWSSSAEGNPVLDAAMAWLDCDLSQWIEVEDHVLAIGKVVAVGFSADHQEPLAYFRGEFGSFMEM